MAPKIPIARLELSRKEIDAVRRVLKSGQLRAGPVAEKFEAEFARRSGARFAVAVNSGTSALFLASSALLKPGDEAIVPDFTFVATASMVMAAGARPILADIDPETFNLDPADAERRITARTRAIIPVHLYGRPADIGRLLRLARRYKLKIIWDAAQAHGARYHGHDVGSFPDVVCYSFYPSKNMTVGEGGMLLTAKARLAQELRLMRSHGERTRYRHFRLGYNFRLTDVAAALGLEQLRRLETANRRRRRNAAALARGLAGIPGLGLPSERDDIDPVYNSFTIRLDPEWIGMSRDEFRVELARRGVETAVHYPFPLHRQPLFRGFGVDQDFPVSTRLSKTVLSLPVHPALTRRDLRRITEAVREVAGLSQRP